MAKNAGSLEIAMDFEGLQELRDQLREKFGKDIALKFFEQSLRKAMKPGVAKLKQNTPKGPTGNLRRSIKLKVKVYRKNDNAVGLVGYDIGRGSKGYHQGFLEFGTKERRTKGRFASSFERSRDFQILNPTRGRNAGKMSTKPKPPKAFFKTAKAGEQVNLGRMPVGGRTGVPPVKTTFAQTKLEMLSLLKSEVAKKLQQDLEQVKQQVERRRRR